MWFHGPGWYVALSNSDGFDRPTLWLDKWLQSGVRSYSGNSRHPKIADFNSDGMGDYMWCYEEVWYVALSRGDKFDFPRRWLDSGSSPNGRSIGLPHQFVGDFTGNGHADYPWYYSGWYVASALLPPKIVVDFDQNGFPDGLDNCTNAPGGAEGTGTDAPCVAGVP